ncbi:TPA: hypothetical protein ACIWR0_005221 [Escherichia coli]|uniref:hypothetical protein n=1 Tax=Escherichia coli TaxID=562 RepID=UPI000B7CD1DF|nr:hypothetical protein [Escherichia coli]EEZ6491561.1 hypothetical protein [Escherichia coli O156]MCZ5917482.1 hypothetical protein [Escherichia coli]HBM8437857.1 hypothetical protein [Escherichia coli]HDI6133071.1 hypothetical protein [Escherichia coli]
MTNVKYIKYLRCKGIWNLASNFSERIFNDSNASIKILGYSEFKANYYNLFLNLNKDYDSQSKTKREYVNSKINTFDLMYSNSAIIELSISIDLKEIDTSDADLFWGKSPYKEIESKILSSLTTAFSLCRNSNISPEYELIDEGLFIEVENKIVKKISTSKIIDGPTMSELTRGELDSIIYLTKKFYNDENLGSILDLFHNSLIPDEVGRLHSFISAWTCLEIFIAKNFKQNFNKLIDFAKEKTKNPEINQQFIDRMFVMMEGKYRLMDKFILLASYYNIAEIDDKIKEFKELKKIRDSFFHGDKIEINDLPLEQTRDLFIMFIKLKLDQNL